MNQMQRNWVIEPRAERMGEIEAAWLQPSRAQREAWLMSQAGSAANLACVQSLTLRLCGKLDVPALRLALQDLVDRHIALRISFDKDGARLCVSDTGVLELAVDDLSGEVAQRRDAAVAEALGQAVAAPFDLGTGPLLRGRLLRLGAEHHLLVLALHRAAGDRRLLALLLKELAVLYACQLGQRDTVLHAGAARETSLEDQADNATLEAMLQRLATLDPLDLPHDFPRPPRPRLEAAYCERSLNTPRDALERFAARHGASAGDVALAAFAVLLARFTGQSAMLIAAPCGETGGFARASMWQLLPLQLDTEQGFATLLRALPAQRAATGACGLGDLLERSVEVRPLALPAVSFSHEGALDGASLSFPGLVAEVACNPRRAEWFELSVNLVVGQAGLALECHYQGALFAAATIEHWLEVYDTVLAAALQQPDLPLQQLRLLGESALQRLDALQPAASGTSPDGFIHAHIDALCAEHPLRTAQQTVSGETSYGELATWSNRIAHELLAQGIGPGDRVGLCLPRDGDLLPALLAVLKTGAAYVPLDPAFPAERLAFMAADSGLRLVLSRDELAERCGLSHLAVLELDRARAQLLQRPAQSPPPLTADPRTTPAYVIYTSGSTGTPKGVVLPHAAVSNFLEAMRQAPGLAAEQRLLAVTTLSFDIAVLELLLPLWVGATTVIATREQAGDGRALRELLHTSGAKVMQATPATWRLLLDAGFEPPGDFVALCGGEALQPDLAAQLQRHGAALWNLYGPTETTVWSAAWQCAPRARHRDRTADPQYPHLRAGCARPALSVGRAGRDLHRRRRRRARLPRARCAECGALPARSVRRHGRGEDVSHRRSWPLGQRRPARASRAARPSGQAARLSDRTRRDRSAPGRTRCRGPVPGHRPRGPAR